MQRVISGAGRFFVTGGILILLFVAYQLWGTGFYTAREQDALKADFTAELRDAMTTTTTAGIPPPPPPSGEAIAIIRIPKIGLDSAVVQGVTIPDLRKGPGHYPDSPLPGQLGNAAIAGHRTTYGAPFNRIDELAVDDPIVVRTLEGTFTYKVTEQLVVTKRDVYVLDPTPTPTLTLTTCHPKFSAAQRLIVKASLENDRSAEPTKPRPVAVASRTDRDKGLSGEESERLPTLGWALAVAFVGALWWLVFHRYHRWTTWLMGAIPFAVVLLGLYFHLERMLPSSY
ncbi:MAG: class E sortase [Actinobacteria bacterium]|nr:class E sortase [Actinomycetota bacterium]